MTQYKIHKEKKANKVYVAISGGVDSSVALALLQREGYDVTGVYFKTYKPESNEEHSRRHCRKQGLDAQAVCEHLGVPFKVFDLEDEYRQKVFDYMIGEYKVGRTPNPDIICNKEIKFGAFLQKALEDGADLIATGHYASKAEQQGKALLLKAVDTNKDQTYFLSQLSQEQLSRAIFPIGKLQKSEVRELAKSFGLLTADKKDSQGICFIGQEIDVKSFLKKYIPEQIGDVLNVSGEVIGLHKGVKFSTIGERHGFTIDPQHQTPEMPRLFVIERDIDVNTITVGTLKELEQVQQGKTLLQISEASWINESPESGKEYTCRIRHRGELYKCKIDNTEARSRCEVEFLDLPYAPAAGQFLTVYNGDRCLGGGVML